MEKIIITYSAPDGEDVHGEKSAKYCVGCGFFNGGDQESNPGEAKGYGTCCPDVSTGLPPRECAVYASRVFHEMLRDLYALRGLLVSTRHRSSASTAALHWRPVKSGLTCWKGKTPEAKRNKQ